MTNKTIFWELFGKMPVIGIMRNIPPDKMEAIAKIYCEAGLTNLEITMNSAGASETINALASAFGGKLNIGAGTVCSLEELKIALSAGAQFIVTPVLNEDIIKSCVLSGIPIFPGAYTPTEIYKAWFLGATMVKIFPATQLGPAYIKEVLAPLNQIKLLPTGGVNLDNFCDFLKAGARGLGIGSNLFPGHLIEKNKWNELSILFSDFVKKYHFEINQ